MSLSTLHHSTYLYLLTCLPSLPLRRRRRGYKLVRSFRSSLLQPCFTSAAHTALRPRTWTPPPSSPQPHVHQRGPPHPSAWNPSSPAQPLTSSDRQTTSLQTSAPGRECPLSFNYAHRSFTKFLREAVTAEGG
ncbi:hypothetical protein Pcinc_027287 [Petrolisthes cinctipes]|uniref:Uncharacterized protein n=1 Tax=Petrolisthes cinctipes TaxID=88211 RepID=A0AAE1F5A8_PETCI|nr:hypothetical protein Pcinc_027287 [Petrolisthes cinctipes]